MVTTSDLEFGRSRVRFSPGAPNSPEVPSGFSKSSRTISKGFQKCFHILKGFRNCFKHSEKQICFNSDRNLYDLYLLSNSSPVGLNHSKKNYMHSAVQLDRSKKNCICSVDPFRTACLAVSYPFACRVFSHSNRYRKECFRMRGHISYNVDRCYDFTCHFCF